jgi:hypothetical protein
MESSDLEAFDEFPFEDKPEFQQLLVKVLSSSTADSEQLTLKTKVAYYKRQTGFTIDLDEYRAWKEAKSGYPTNYQNIVELIMAGKPIPGIKQVPNTVLGEDASSEPKAQPRPKPWEK